MSPDLVLRNASLGDGRTADVHVTGGVIVAVETAGLTYPPGVQVDELGGMLLMPAMAEPHAHLDKALTADVAPNRTGDLMGAINAYVEAMSSGRFTHDDVVKRTSAALELLLTHGFTAVRTHVDVGAEVGVGAVKAVAEVRRSFQHLMDIQIVALTHTPLSGVDGIGNRRSMVEALTVGADLVGACPALDVDGPGVIRAALEVATDAGVGIDLHVDETLDADILTLRELARQVIQTGFSHQVNASHCVSLSMQSPEVQRQVALEVAEARISVVALPQTNLYLQGWDHVTAMPRGIVPIDVLRTAGVLVAAGADNVQDPFNPVGRSDGLETAALLVMAAHQDPQRAYDMVSNDARAVMGLARISMQPGDPADLLAISVPSVRAAIADAPMSRRVYRRGVLVASSTASAHIHRGGQSAAQDAALLAGSKTPNDLA